MPNMLNDYAVDLMAQPTTISAVAAADVAVGAAGTYVDAVSLGTVQPGLYQLTATAQYLNGAGAAFVNTKILCGTIVVPGSNTENSCIATGSIQIVISCLLHVVVAAVVKLQVTSTTATGSVKAANANGGALTGATAMTAVRIK